MALKPLAIRLEEDTINEIKTRAANLGKGPSVFARDLLLEKLESIAYKETLDAAEQSSVTVTVPDDQETDNDVSGEWNTEATTLEEALPGAAEQTGDEVEVELPKKRPWWKFW